MKQGNAMGEKTMSDKTDEKIGNALLSIWKVCRIVLIIGLFLVGGFFLSFIPVNTFLIIIIILLLLNPNKMVEQK